MLVDPKTIPVQEYTGKPALDIVVPKENKEPTGDDILDSIDNEELASYINGLLRNDTMDKEQGFWTEKRLYDINSYEGNKKPTDYPWVNCSNFPVPLTPTLVDTAHSNTMGSIFANPEQTVAVQGVGIEDIRKAPVLAELLNWQINTETVAYEVLDKVFFRAYLNGTGIVKIIQSLFLNKVLLNAVPVDNIYLPVDAKGFQPEHSDHVIEVISLTQNDIMERRLLKDPKTGKPIYDGIDEIRPGFRIMQSSALESVTRQKDFISGTKVGDRMNRDLYFILECYVTYYIKDEQGNPVKPVELIVWMAPSSNKILRKAVNVIGKRPYVAFIPYPRDDRFFGMSLPEKIRAIQEELDYAHNQNINAADRAISPPTFYDPDGGFDPELHQITPGCTLPSKTPPTFSNIQVNPIFERQEDRYWDLAERLTGLTELFQGRAPSKTKTLGEAKLRNNRTEIRFKDIYQRLENGFSELIQLMYFYDTLFMPAEKKVKVLGVGDYKTISELFPNGMEGNFNFTFRNPPVTETEVKKQDTIEMCEYLMETPLVQLNAGNMYRVMKKFSEAKGERNLETLVTKPDEAYIESPEEMIQRIMSGQYDAIPDPGIQNASSTITRIKLFSLTDTFKEAPMEAKQAFALLIHRLEQIQRAQFMARMHANALKQGDPRQAALTETVDPETNPQAVIGRVR